MSEISQTERVSDEELDQMIWKLERDGLTPKMLSLMRELREVRKAKGEPVMYCSEETVACAKDGELLLRTLSSPSGDCVIPLYIALPAPVVPDTLPCPVFLEPGLKFGKGVRTQCMLDALNRRAEYHAELDAMTPEQLAEHDAGIAEFKAILGGGFRDLSTPVDPQVAEYEEIMDRAIPDNSFTNEELEAMAYGNNPQANAYRELLARRNSPVIPDGWIPVSERMPENATGVLVASPWQCTPGGYAMKWAVLCPGHPDADSDGWVIPGASWSPTHWMPLPAAPKEVG